MVTKIKQDTFRPTPLTENKKGGTKSLFLMNNKTPKNSGLHYFLFVPCSLPKDLI